ncbi:uncharacterized protein TNCT_326221 [Trichonephila clavata]|uniref:Uncharacterized protein n=1 Tax=Trichonephila clavata TaxID=2740835 RepID=A0A8X6JKK3_TRICU|nr:uncharacterized protein TNCT_326221 [Trichonephila clavata]
MKVTKNYNLILQDINRKYPATVNKVTGDWIKIQCASSDNHREITISLVEKKIEHWVVDPIANRPIKVVIKGLPASTSVEEIEHDLKEQRVAVEKVAQLRKFKTQAPLPICMVEVKRVENATDIHEIKFLHNKLQHEIKKDLLRHKQQTWDRELEGANYDIESLHKIIGRKKKQATYPPLLGYRGLVYGTIEKTDLFVDSLEELKNPLRRTKHHTMTSTSRQ